MKKKLFFAIHPFYIIKKTGRQMATGMTTRAGGANYRRVRTTLPMFSDRRSIPDIAANGNPWLGEWSKKNRKVREPFKRGDTHRRPLMRTYRHNFPIRLIFYHRIRKSQPETEQKLENSENMPGLIRSWVEDEDKKSGGLLTNFRDLSRGFRLDTKSEAAVRQFIIDIFSRCKRDESAIGFYSSQKTENRAHQASSGRDH